MLGEDWPSLSPRRQTRCSPVKAAPTPVGVTGRSQARALAYSTAARALVVRAKHDAAAVVTWPDRGAARPILARPVIRLERPALQRRTAGAWIRPEQSGPDGGAPGRRSLAWSDAHGADGLGQACVGARPASPAARVLTT